MPFRTTLRIAAEMGMCATPCALSIQPVLFSRSEQARMLNLANGDLVRLSLANAKSLTAPVWIMPGQARDCVVALLGFGRQQTGSKAEGGTNFYPLTGYTEAAALQKLGGRVELASTEHQCTSAACLHWGPSRRTRGRSGNRSQVRRHHARG